MAEDGQNTDGAAIPAAMERFLLLHGEWWISRIRVGVDMATGRSVTENVMAIPVTSVPARQAALAVLRKYGIGATVIRPADGLTVVRVGADGSDGIERLRTACHMSRTESWTDGGHPDSGMLPALNLAMRHASDTQLKYALGLLREWDVQALAHVIDGAKTVCVPGERAIRRLHSRIAGLSDLGRDNEDHQHAAFGIAGKRS